MEIQRIIPKCYDGHENYVFVSYSHANSKEVMEDIGYLQYNGYRIWFDDGLKLGDIWKDEVFLRIKSTKCNGILIYVSEESFFSGALVEELRWADRFSKRILSIIIDSRLPDIIYDEIVGKMSEEQKKVATTIVRYFAPDVISLFRVFPDEEYYSKLCKVLDVLNIKQTIENAICTEKERELQMTKRAYIKANLPILNFCREISFFQKIDSSFDNIISSKDYFLDCNVEIIKSNLLRMVMLVKSDKNTRINKVCSEKFIFCCEGEEKLILKSKRPINCKYTEDVKGRDYDVLCVDLFLNYQLVDAIKKNLLI